MHQLNVNKFHEKDRLKVLCLNADTLTNKMAEFNYLVQNQTPHIIGVSEVLPKHFNSKIYTEEFQIDGYEMIPHRNVADNKGRGSILYIKNTITYKYLELDKDNVFDENITIEIPLTGNDTLICALMYRRGLSNAENNQNMINIFTKLSDINPSHLLIMGDMNFNDINWDNLTCKTTNKDDINYKFLECIRDCYLFQHVNENTRQRGEDNPSMLDLIFTNEEYMIPSVEYLSPLGKSDHSTLKFEIICKLDKKPPKIVTQINKGNYKQMKEALASVDWEEHMNADLDVNELWKIFTDKYYTVEKDYIPTKTVYIDGKKSKRLSMPLDRKKSTEDKKEKPSLE